MKLSVVIPTRNEEENAKPIYEAVTTTLNQDLSEYEYEIIFIDNCSTDNTRFILQRICDEDKHVKAIFNTRNFGQFNSPFYGLMQATGDAAILLCADFQDPVEMLPQFVREWEAGNKIVAGIKKKSRENKVIRFFRTCYYKIIKKMSDVEQIEHFTGFGLYDKCFIDTLRKLNDPIPFLRGIVAELGPARKEISYEQQKRRAGKTSNNFYSLYDAAMLSFTSYTKMGLRVAIFAGAILSVLSIVAALVYLILKMLYWDRFPAGNIPILLATLVFGALQLFFIGLLGEYILNINRRVMGRPLVVEERRINFDD